MGNTYGTDLSKTDVPKLHELLEQDPYLNPYEAEIRRRYGLFKLYTNRIENEENGLDKFTKSYEKYGMQIDSSNNIDIVEWAPAAKNVYLKGQFSKSFINQFQLI